MDKESKSRLLSAVCLLNNSNTNSSTFDSPRALPGNPSAGQLSPKSRRSSLPVGPMGQGGANAPPPTVANLRQRTSISEKQERKESLSSLRNALTRTESEDSTNSKPEADSPRPLQEEEDLAEDKDSGEMSFTVTPEMLLREDDGTKDLCLLQESNCDSELDSEVCLLPDLVVPVRSKHLSVLSFLQRVSVRRLWRWDNAWLLLHARYALSALLATAAMLTLVFTFLPNRVVTF